MKRLLLLLFLLPIIAAAEEPKKLPRGCKPTPRYKLQAATPHRVIQAAPAQFAIVPKQLSMWYNDTYGDCVTAQEAFSKAVWSIQCGLPELFVPDAEVKRWATANGVLNGADLPDVMTKMAKNGFNVDGKNYKDGPYAGVDYSNETVLQNAIFTGPVNIAIDADALPSGAGNQSGWYTTGTGRFPNTDHCVALCGYGPAEYLYKQLGLTTPTALAGKSGYLLFTWSTIGFVDHAWLMGTCTEAWVRNPTTPGQSPTPNPPDPPNPPNPPTPSVAPLFTLTFNKAIKQGGLVWFLAPTAIPSGAKLLVYPPGVTPSLPGDPPFEEQSRPEPSPPPMSPAKDGKKLAPPKPVSQGERYPKSYARYPEPGSGYVCGKRWVDSEH